MTNSFSTKQLELDKILAFLAEEAYSDEAKNTAIKLLPDNNITAVNKSLAQTEAAYILSMKYGHPSFYGLKLCTEELKRAEAGGMLSMGELLRISNLLRILRETDKYRSLSSDTSTCLDDYFDSLSTNKYLEDKINGSILSEEEMSDTASPQLASIRRKIRLSSGKARDVLEKIIRSSSMQKYLQDAIITIRDGRFVIPVKSEHKNDVPGLVHDTSGSGSTLFVEPIAAVEANNELKVLETEEKKEIERILRELSSEVGTFAEKLMLDNITLTELDFIFAKASFAIKHNCTVPKINNDGLIVLNKARHLLINKDKVVPIDITVGGEFSSLIVTGPNTGGKTVALKTTGLITLMAMCGLMIPAGEESHVSVFNKILADIGDEQSIEQSLSTFSAHMTNIVRIIKLADEDSLILLDELGSGTDPVEGAALAETILEHLKNKRSRVLATTHYAELKLYALQNEGVQNACCEFDVQTLKPTYKLLIGVPGRSNAFAISERLGLPKNIVEEAKGKINEENSRFEDVLSNLEVSRQNAEEGRREAELMRAEAAKLMRDAKEESDRILKKAERDVEKAKTDAKRILEMTRFQSDKLLSELEQLKKEADKNDKAQTFVKARTAVRSSMGLLEDTVDPIDKDNDKKLNPNPPKNLKVGDEVTVLSMNKDATVTSVNKDGTVEVMAGIMKMRLNTNELTLKTGKKKQDRTGLHRNVSTVVDVAKTEIDIRGYNVEEAIMELDKFIDDAVLRNLEGLRIIHGKGTGVLRTGVHKYLKSNRSVKSFRLGTYGEGEMGVTVITLK